MRQRPSFLLLIVASLMGTNGREGTLFFAGSRTS